MTGVKYGTRIRQPFDGPWKTLIRLYLHEMLLLLLPSVANVVDWHCAPEFLDKELQQLRPRGAKRSRAVDVLVKLTRLTGEPLYLILHIEVQNQYESTFSERMFGYFSRLREGFAPLPVLSFAILGDDRIDWRPTGYDYDLLGCRVSFEFPIVKLLDFEQKLSQVTVRENPFAILARAHLASVRTLNNSKYKADERFRAKITLVRELYQSGLKRDDIIQLFGLIDWLIQLPPQDDERFTQTIAELEAAQAVNYVTSIERVAEQRGSERGEQVGLARGEQVGLERGEQIGLERGEQIGLQKMARELKRRLRQLLERRFGTLSEPVTARLAALNHAQCLSAMELLFDWQTPADLEQWLLAQPAVSPALPADAF